MAFPRCNFVLVGGVVHLRAVAGEVGGECADSVVVYIEGGVGDGEGHHAAVEVDAECAFPVDVCGTVCPEGAFTLLEADDLLFAVFEEGVALVVGGGGAGVLGDGGIDDCYGDVAVFGAVGRFAAVGGAGAQVVGAACRGPVLDFVADAPLEGDVGDGCCGTGFRGVIIVDADGCDAAVGGAVAVVRFDAQLGAVHVAVDGGDGEGGVAFTVVDGEVVVASGDVDP